MFYRLGSFGARRSSCWRSSSGRRCLGTLPGPPPSSSVRNTSASRSESYRVALLGPRRARPGVRPRPTQSDVMRSRRAAVVDDANDDRRRPTCSAQTLPEPIRTRSLQASRPLHRYEHPSLAGRYRCAAARRARQSRTARSCSASSGDSQDRRLLKHRSRAPPRLYVETLNTMIDQQTVRDRSPETIACPGPVLAVEVIFAAAALGLLAFYLAILGRGVLPVAARRRTGLPAAPRHLRPRPANARPHPAFPRRRSPACGPRWSCPGRRRTVEA